MLRKLAAIFGLGIFCTHLFSQPRQQLPSIKICGAVLHLNMPQDRVQKMLTPNCTATLENENGTAWYLMNKPETGSHSPLAGRVEFKSGKLISVHRDFAFSSTAVSSMEAIFFAIEDIVGGAGSRCSVKAVKDETPEVRSKRLDIGCGGKRAVVLVLHKIDIDIVSVTEVLD